MPWTSCVSQPPDVRAGRGLPRLGRATVIATIAVALGGAGHMLVAGSSRPSPAVMGAVALLLGMIAWRWARCEWGSRRLFVWLALGQMATHGALMLSALTSHPAESWARRLSGTMFLCHSSSAAGLAGGHSHAALIAMMLGAHGVATTICAWWLRRGEAWVWRRLRTVGKTLVRAIAGLWPRGAVHASTGPTTHMPSGLETLGRLLCPLGAGHAERGPPGAPA